MSYRIFHAAGPGNVIEAHKHWIAGEDDPTQMSITFSSQFEEFCRNIGAEAYIVSSFGVRHIFREGPFTLEHRPKPMSGSAGIRYHLSEILYGLGLIATALRFRADMAVIDSGTSHYFIFSLFRLARIRVVIELHNTLWPAGFPPIRPVPRFIARLDSLFFRWVPSAVVGVSPECGRQVKQLTKGRHKPLYQFRGQFHREYFESIPAPPPHNQHPFRIMFAGRINRDKGVFDILEMAKRIEARAPGRVQWELCGSGSDLEELRLRHRGIGLESIVSIRGWVSPQDMREVIARSHLSIVPTRSEFSEGMAMTVIEGILAGRPVLTNPVVPALEVLRPACVEARTDDIQSYVEAILNLIDNPDRYQALCKSCPYLGRQFYDREQGLSAVLRNVFNVIQRTGGAQH